MIFNIWLLTKQIYTILQNKEYTHDQQERSKQDTTLNKTNNIKLLHTHIT